MSSGGIFVVFYDLGVTTTVVCNCVTGTDGSHTSRQFGKNVEVSLEARPMTITYLAQSSDKWLHKITALPDEARLEAFCHAFVEGFDANTVVQIVGDEQVLTVPFLAYFLTEECFEERTKTTRSSGPTSTISLFFFSRTASILGANTERSAQPFLKRF